MIPNSSRWKQNRPNELMKVVSNADLGERGTCQNPELVSSLVNNWAPASWASIDSVVDACPYAHSGLVGSSPHRFSLFHLP